MKSRLSTSFGGLELKNPFVIASAPPSESIASIVKCAEAGAGAIITKTMADFDSEGLLMGARRSFSDRHSLWAQGTFRHETLTMKEGLKLITGSILETDVPIIASIGFLTLDPEAILASCLEAERAGASMIHLDMFYIPQPRVSAESIARIQEIFVMLNACLSIPFGPKFNHDFPPYIASEIVRMTNPDVLFLLDSHRTPVPIDIYKNGRSKMNFLENAVECSQFGRWQKPICMQYTSVLARNNHTPICAGGGLENANDAIEALMYGATTVQFATAIIRHGYKFISRTVEKLEAFLDRQGYVDIASIRGLANTHLSGKQEQYIDAKAVVDHELCINCGKCTDIVFCGDIFLNNSGKVTIEDSCDGCGLCAAVCPIPHALEIKKI